MLNFNRLLVALFLVVFAIYTLKTDAFTVSGSNNNSSSDNATDSSQNNYMSSQSSVSRECHVYKHRCVVGDKSSKGRTICKFNGNKKVDSSRNLAAKIRCPREGQANDTISSAEIVFYVSGRQTECKVFSGKPDSKSLGVIVKSMQSRILDFTATFHAKD